ncbi:siroheme synthase [Hygrophoropsis aurantiaca]|uniref:Siroheme synthase n=1 Tax=Hygrophoropsis aurantiaca TaxID=72124 RepID=A0ACB8AAR6_9AGAM|nr:siroheme synthase [Hygrophoropsis aurantiaca]
MTAESSNPGGSLLLAWQLKNKHVLIIGGGEVASGRIESVLIANARITIICPSQGLHSITKRFINGSHPITYHDRVFDGAEDLDDVDMVLTAIDDVAQSRIIYSLCRDLKIPVNVADIPDSCDFYFGSQIRDGPLQIMISTNGQSPKLANIIKKKIQKSLPNRAGEAIRKVGDLRSKLKDRAPGVGGEVSKRRMKWMVDVCTSWEMDDLALLNEETIKRLLDDGWETNSVPPPDDVVGRRNRTFDAAPTSIHVFPCMVAFIAGAACAGVLLFSRHR